MSVAFRIKCCLCRKNVPLAGDVIALDSEWQRRHPGMRGTLACERCPIVRGWNCCTTTRGAFVDGHVAAPDGDNDIDSWSHLLGQGAHRAMVVAHPRSGLLQGAEPYLRWFVDHQRMALNARLGAALDEWDAARQNAATAF